MSVEDFCRVTPQMDPMLEPGVLAGLLLRGNYNNKLGAVQIIKKLFCKNFKMVPNIRLASLIENVSSLNKSLAGLGRDYLINLSTSLTDFIGEDMNVDVQLLQLLESIFLELKKLDERCSESLVKYIWEKLKINYPNFVGTLLMHSSKVLEELVLDWLCMPHKDMTETCKLSVESPEIFQAITGIIHQILIKTNGHEAVLKLADTYVRTVIWECRKNKKDFLVLYPVDCRRLVSLLFVPPEDYPTENNKVVRQTALELLLVNFTENRSRTLLLLSHFPEWIPHFKSYLVSSKGS